MTNPFAAAISTLIDRIAALTEKASYETARERQALLGEAEELRVGWRVLEAAGFLLPMINIPDDGKWYQLTANIRRAASEPIVVEGLSVVAALPDGGRT